MKKIMNILLVLLTSYTFSQTPNIAYSVQSSYSVNSNINLTPTNSGGQPTFRTQVSTLAGTQFATPFQNGTPAIFTWPIATAYDNGNVYVVDDYWPCIRKIDFNGDTSTLAGQSIADMFGNIQYGYADGQGALAQFNNPKGLAVDLMGNVYVADTNNHRIRKITPSGLVTTIAGNDTINTIDGIGTNASFYYPYSLCVDTLGNIYVLDLKNWPNGVNSACVIRKIDTNGVVTTIAGSTLFSGNLNGQGTTARFNWSKGITIDSLGNLYVADSDNNVIRKIDTTGLVTTFASGFNYPIGITIDGDNNLYIADSFGAKISKVTPSGVISDYAGAGFSGSGTNAQINGLGNVALFNNPNGLSIDSNKTIYVADRNTTRIRKVVLLQPYTISPNLPSGLIFNPLTGIISGTPTALTPLTTYTITAANYNGVFTTTISFSITNACPITVWNGVSWSMGVPDASTTAQIDGDLTVTNVNSFTCCDLIVNANLIIDSGFINVMNDIIVN